MRRLQREAAAAQSAAEPSREVANLVAGLSIAAGIRPPKVVMLQVAVPNACVAGTRPRNTTIGITTGLVDVLSRSELEAVIARQIARVANPDIVLTTWATAMTSSAVRRLDGMVGFDVNNPFAFGGGGRIVGAFERWISARYELHVLRYFAARQDRAAVAYTLNPRALLASFEILHANTDDVGCVSRVTAPLWVEVPRTALNESDGDQRIARERSLAGRIAALRSLIGIQDAPTS